MVLVDTSVWISLYRKKNLFLGDVMWSLVAKNEAAICGQVLVEFLGGFRKPEEHKVIKNYLQDFPFLETLFAAYQLAAQLLAAFPKLSSGDVIIAATAMIHKVPLLTTDKDFGILQQEGLILQRDR